MLIYFYKFTINQGAWLLKYEMRAPKPAEAAWGSLVGPGHPRFFPGLFLLPLERGGAHRVSRGRSLFLLEKPRAHPVPSDLAPLCTLNWHPLQLGTWNRPSPQTGLGASWIPASFILGTEEDSTCSSGNLLRHGSEVMWKWGVSYLSEPWECRRGHFGKSSWELLLQKKTQPKANGPFDLKLHFTVKHLWGL